MCNQRTPSLLVGSCSRQLAVCLAQLEAPQDAAVPVAPELVSIDVPLVMVTHPVELSGTGPEFHVITDLHVSNMTLFRHLFANDFICLSLDNAPSSCWPLSQSDVRPLFVNVPDGLHTLVASLTHPSEGRIIQVCHTDTEGSREDSDHKSIADGLEAASHAHRG